MKITRIFKKGMHENINLNLSTINLVKEDLLGLEFMGFQKMLDLSQSI